MFAFAVTSLIFINNHKYDKLVTLIFEMGIVTQHGR